MELNLTCLAIIIQSLKVGAFLIKSKCVLDEDQTYAPKGVSSSLPKYDFLELQSSDLCDHFEVKLDDCEVCLQNLLGASAFSFAVS